MRDKPDAAELLDSVEFFLTSEVVSNFQGRRRFHALVAANAVRIVARELRLGPGQDAGEVGALWALLGRAGAPPDGADRSALLRELNTELSRRIDAGEADAGEFHERVVRHLEATVVQKLAVDNPKALERGSV